MPVYAEETLIVLDKVFKNCYYGQGNSLLPCLFKQTKKKTTLWILAMHIALTVVAFLLVLLVKQFLMC